MPGPEFPDAPPPEVPEEFAAAYRDAYQRALETGHVDDAGSALGVVAPEVPVEHTQVIPEPSDGVVAATSGPLDRWRASRWFLVSVVTAAAAVLVAAAYAVGTTVSHGDDHGTSGVAVPQSSRTTGPARSGSPSKVTPTHRSTAHVPNAWDGPVRPVSVDAIAADCTAPPGTDSAGNKVTYVPENATDGRAQTAWRCDGAATGQKLTLRLSGATDIAEVGLVPGYAKTDPASGTDRYAENNRITKVRWTLADGVTVVQRLDPDPSSRAMQVLRVPRTTTDTVTLQILAVAHGPRDTTAISEISLAEAAS
ncbi:NADase-type glycan-binding domain-containing protein [Nocardioides pocheonensis]|uniref:NADase-type glycan-binding domain-containing protein n=1 Tax=Nocardioides pocheonensis TaxID=661485 RepID=UPI0011CE9158|nr:hypothetical protein [Nocardioides pocheonensis]